MFKTTTERKKLKAMGHVTPFIAHYLRNGWMVYKARNG